MRPSTHEKAEASLIPESGGWHCSHLYYALRRDVLQAMDPLQIAAGGEELIAAVDPGHPDAPLRIQAFVVSGHKADFGLMMLDPDPLKLDRVHQRMMNCKLAPAIAPGYSFVSLTEISEYVQSPEDYGQRLAEEGMELNSPEWEARVKAYADRLGAMNKQRLTPDFPDYPAMCFYPMNKKRDGDDNWFALEKEERSRMMIEHARSGIAFAGKVSQLITVGIGLEDFEWGVTLWGRNPEFLKEIVYKMRFDEASAKYAEFGPFLTGYIMSMDHILKHCLTAEGTS